MKGLQFALLSVSMLLAGVAHAQPAAEVLEWEAKFTMTSPTEARYEVHKRILVNKQSGAEAGTFLLHTDEFHTLSSFSGNISSGGKVVRKFNRGDVYVSLESEALATKSYVNAYEPVAPYPFEIEYNYTVSYRKAIASFPSFFPMVDYDVPVRKASYTVTVPWTMKIQYKASSKPEETLSKNNMVYRWEFSDLAAISHEESMPSLTELVPYVHASPLEFQYAGTSGTQHDWKEVGQWLWSLMPARPEVPENVRKDIEALTKDCGSDLEKVRVVYDYLRTHTRYISIQLGIGGFAPIAPEQVAATGFGDCKALSFYMRQLLALLGIPSDYVIVNTERRNLYEGYASVGQMDHAILRVPLQQDTLWVECTNPSVPLGYSHMDIAGHEVVLIRPEGGVQTRVGDYPDSVRLDLERQEVLLSADGAARIVVDRKARLSRAETFFNFAAMKDADQRKVLLSGIQGHPESFRVESFSDNFRDYDGKPGYVPEARIRFSLNLSGVGRVSGDRMFVKTAPFQRAISFQKTARKYDMVTGRGRTIRDSVVFVIPEGYEIEHLPEGKSLSCAVADFRQEFHQTEGGVLAVSEIRMKPGRLPAADYAEYRDLAKAINKAYEGTLVLKKKP